MPQLRALETYWYLRLVHGTPHIFDLYTRLYPPDTNTADLLDALGVPEAAFRATNYPLDALWDRIATDDGFVRDYRLQTLRETMALAYPSYILALAMGAGKTILIGAIVATEFAMAIEYPDGPFVQNALVFAPGKTIIQSLRELALIPYDRVLPPRMHRPFAASVKLTFTRDGEKDIPVVRRSAFTPDFVIRKKPPPGGRRGTGKVLIVEVKSHRERAHPVDGEGGLKAMALRKWENLNPDRVKYGMIFTTSDIVTADQMRGVRGFVQESER